MDGYEDIIAAALPASKPPPLMKIVRGAEHLKGVQPDLLTHWNNLQSEFSKAGLSPVIKSGFRTAEQQNALHRRGLPTKGNDGFINISPHQEGRALDISFAGPQKAKGRQVIAEYARRAGLQVPSDEPWHISLPKQDDYSDIVNAAIPKTVTTSSQADSYDDVIQAAIAPKAKKPVSPFAKVKAGVRGIAPRPVSIGELRQSEDVPIGFSRTGQPSRVTQTPDELRVMKGEQPADRQSYARQQDAQARLGQMKELGNDFDPKKEEQWRAANQGAIDLETENYRRSIRQAKASGGDAAQWLAEFGSKAGAGLAELGAGATGSDVLRIKAEAAARAAQEEGADRNVVSMFVQDVGAGLISSAPELAAMTLSRGRIGPVAAFGAGGALRAGGSGRDPSAGAVHGAGTGLAFEVPGIGQGVKKILTKSGGVGAASAGVELAAGAEPYDAATAGATNALLVGVPGLIGGKRARTERRVGDIRDVRPAELPETGNVVAEAPQQFQHLQFGKVQVLPDQTGARPGKIRVAEVADLTKQHFVRKSDMQGRGNARMIPIKESAGEQVETPVTPAEVRKQEAVPQAQSTVSPASASVPFMITRKMQSDLRGRGYSQPEIDKLTPRQANDILAQPAESTTTAPLPIESREGASRAAVEDGETIAQTQARAIALRDERSNLQKTIPAMEDYLKSGRVRSVDERKVLEDSLQRSRTRLEALEPEYQTAVMRIQADYRRSQESLEKPTTQPLVEPKVKEVSNESTALESRAEIPKTKVAIESKEGAGGGRSEMIPPAPSTIPLEQLTRAELKQRVRRAGPRQKEYQQELTRRYEDRTLQSFVRDSGGMTPSYDLRGELARVSRKETGTTGLINKNARQGSHKQSVEYMMDMANVEGFRDINGDKFTHPGDFLLAVESDSGHRRGYTKLNAADNVDFDAEERAYHKSRQEEYDADARVTLLENDQTGGLYDKIAAGTANETEINSFRKHAERAGLSPEGTQDLIASARTTSEQAAAQVQTAAAGKTGEAGYLKPKLAKEGVYEPASTPILKEVERATLNGNAQRPSLRQYARRAKSYVQRSLIAEFTPLRELEQTLYGKETVPVVNLARKFEQVAGAPAKAQADIIDFRRNVIDPIRKSADDFNSYLFLKRVEDRLLKEPERKRVADWTVEKAQAGLTELEAKVGADTYKEFAKAGKVYQREMDKALRLQVESGRMSQELYDAIKESSDFYAPFKVLRYIEDADIVRGSGRRIATTQELSKKIKGIDSEDFQLGNILQASAEQIVRSRILAEKNLKMLELDKLADLDPKGELIKRVTEDKARPDQGKEFVRFLKDGKEQILEVDHIVANAVQGLNPKQAGLITQVLMFTRKPLQIGATSANASFQAVNLFFADLPRQALVSRYGVRNVKDVYQFPMDWGYSLFSSIKGNFGRPNQLYMDWLRSGAANSTIQRELTPEAFRPTLGIAKPGAKHLASSVLNSVAKFSNAIEETSKVLGLKRGMKFEGIARMSPAERQATMEKIAAEVRNYSGSPDFARKGSETRDLNLLFMFFNARLQGVVSDVTRLGGRTGTKEAGAAWARLGVGIALPSTLLAIVNSLPENKEDYEKVPDWEKQNYYMIPRESHFTNEDTGETVRDYWRIPKRGIVQLIGNSVESAVQFGLERDPKHAKAWGVDMLENLSPMNIEGRNMGERVESVFGSTNPALKLPAETLMNRDTFRHRAIVPEYMRKAAPAEQYRESTPRGYVAAGKALGISPLQLQHVTEGATGSAASQFSIREQQPGRSALGRFPLTRRFVRSGQTAVDDAQTQEQTDFATKQLQRRRERQEAVRKYRAGEISKADLDKLEEDDKLTESDVKRVQKEAGLSNIQQRFTAIPPNVALDRFERMDARQRNEVLSLMEHKAYTLLNSTALTEAQKEDFKTRIEALGITPRDPRKKVRAGFKNAFGKGFSRSQFATQ